MSRAWIRAWVRGWIKRNIIDDDPHEPEPTHGPDFDGRYYPDDESDGLVQQPSGLWIDTERFNKMAQDLAA